MQKVDHLYVIAKGAGSNQKFAKLSSTGYSTTTHLIEAAEFTDMGAASFMLGVLKADDPNEFVGYRIREKIGDKLKRD